MSNYVDVIKKGATEASRFDLTNATGFSVVKEEGITTIEIDVPDVFGCNIILYTEGEYKNAVDRVITSPVDREAYEQNKTEFDKCVRAFALETFLDDCHNDRTFVVDLELWVRIAKSEVVYNAINDNLRENPKIKPVF